VEHLAATFRVLKKAEDVVALLRAGRIPSQAERGLVREAVGRLGRVLGALQQREGPRRPTCAIREGRRT
jgi:hypothetical protein